MQYALLIYESPVAFEGRLDGGNDAYVAAWRSFYESVLASGHYVGGEPLTEPPTGTTVRMREGRRQIQDGPFANTKEQLGGFMILDLPSLDAALEWASRCPAALDGAIEVRPIARDMHLRITTTQGEDQ